MPVLSQGARPYEDAVALLEHADDVANRDRWHGDRDATIAYHVARAQVLATLAVAAQLEQCVLAISELRGV